jgi:polar amino acid transport system substrate-binding protein
MAQSVLEPAARELAPNGKLRAAINYGNPVLAQKGADGEPRGVSAELARRLGTPIAFVEFPSAGATFDALAQDSWDVAFLAADPKRAERIAFSAPYVRIEGAYLVRAGSAFAANEDVDRPGVRIAVGKGSAYALYLQRALKSAKLVEAPTSAGAVDLFVSQRLDVAAGVRQPIEAYAKAHIDVRVLPGRFMVIDQAVATPIARLAAARYLHSFVEELKASGFVVRALAASGQMDAAIAPPDPVK